MIFGRSRWTALVTAIMVGCGSEPTTMPGDGLHARVRVLTATQSATSVDMLVDGQPVVSAVAYGQLSSFVNVSPGTHTVGFRRVGSAAVTSQRSLTFGADTNYTIVAIDSSSVINPGVLTDTGARPVAGKSKLRVVHFATHAPAIDVWRTQPDFTTPIRVMFPFVYRAASPYLQSDPGIWSVSVTAEGTTAPNLFATNLTIPSGETRTVVLLDDGSGGVEAVILDR